MSEDGKKYLLLGVKATRVPADVNPGKGEYASRVSGAAAPPEAGMWKIELTCKRGDVGEVTDRLDNLGVSYSDPAAGPEGATITFTLEKPQAAAVVLDLQKDLDMQNLSDITISAFDKLGLRPRLVKTIVQDDLGRAR